MTTQPVDFDQLKAQLGQLQQIRRRERVANPASFMPS
jgi:hypothetical protein